MIYRYVRWFEEIGKNDVPLVGGKGANLGELTKNGVDVPPGFCVTAQAYREFIQGAELGDRIRSVIESVNVDDPVELSMACEKVRRYIEDSPMPIEVEAEIRSAYRELSEIVGTEEPRVAVRSSATAEDLPDASFAGQQDTYLHIVGVSSVTRHVRRCWASLWTARATAYRNTQGYDHFDVALSAVVQRMISSHRSGVLFTADPVSGDRNRIVIEASWGLGEAVVSGIVTPDQYLLDKKDLTPLDVSVAEKKTMVVERRNAQGTVSVSVAEYLGPEFVSRQCLSGDEIRALGSVGRSIELHYGCPMDVEWAFDEGSGKLFILQARPITTLPEMSAVDVPEENPKVIETPSSLMPQEDAGSLEVLARGLAASPGIASGPVILVRGMDEIGDVQAGQIMVTAMTNPDMVPAMKKAAAVVTDEGGRTCHAAIVSRELGIPCIVGTKDGTRHLESGSLVTVDATRGVVYKGTVSLTSDEDRHSPVAPPASGYSRDMVYDLAPVTGTKIYMNLGDPSVVTKYKNLPFDGIGLMRTEFVFNSLGVHPMHLVKTGEGNRLIDHLSQSVTTVAQAVYPKPMVVRLSDFRTNEFRGLQGGEDVEPEENNPMIGWRGVSRYISPEYEEGFRLECRAIKKVRDEFGLINVWVMLPFVRTTWELERVKDIMASEGLIRNKSFKLWIMAEVPAVVFAADEFATMVDGFSIGSNDLTQLVMGVDRDSGILNTMGYFDERNISVTRAIETLIDAAHRHGITCSICGQGPSLYPDFAEFLVRAGVDSMSVNPDTVAYTRKLVAGVEQRLILGGLRTLHKNN
ncbi:MAG: phosphoenolpyruvate synthase [Dethiosulfovibrio peptidovorans]|nr:MAG: phosphoenolpyruvate synthase [Dethiosulfovibrio peptidovorans]